MDHLHFSFRPVTLFGLACLAFLLGVPKIGHAEGEQVEVIGEYQYTYGDQQTPGQARETACTMAVRKALESHPVYIEETSTVKDPAIIKALVQAITSGYLTKREIVEQTEEGRKVSCKVRGFIEPAVVKTVLNRELNRLQEREPDVVDANKQIKILSATDYAVEDTRKKKTVKEIKVVYQQVGSEATQILIDFYDTKGKPLIGKRSTTQEFLLPGEIR